MAGEREVIDGRLAHIDGDFSDGLHGVAVEKDAPCAAELGDLGNGEEHAGFVIRPHERDASGVRRDGIFRVGERKQAVAIDGQIGDTEAHLFPATTKAKHRRVLDGARDNAPFVEAGAQDETAREEVAELISAHPFEIVFTGGGTENDNPRSTPSEALFFEPKRELLDGLPQSSRKYGSLAVKTSGNTGVVALWSR